MDEATLNELDRLHREDFPAFQVFVVRTYPALYDHILALEHDVQALKRSCDARIHECIERQKERDEAQRQVAALREALDLYQELDDQRNVCDECKDSPELAPEACPNCYVYADQARCAMRQVLADTTAAAEAHEQRVREDQRRQDMETLHTRLVEGAVAARTRFSDSGDRRHLGQAQSLSLVAQQALDNARQVGSTLDLPADWIYVVPVGEESSRG